ncbi:hypothetical protein [Ruania zhangjianzhongii]|uniref:hypothetical protein n=1 Tax=Ruania zhangjianzhongii TaxID=2603206 RepID=UPI0011CC8AA3|nr:hypothetical protein [Ruania zhangjianzhongii]
MDVRWLSAPEGEVEAAISDLDKESRPQVAPKQHALVMVNIALLLVYFGVVWLVFADRIDAAARPRIELTAWRDLGVALVVFALWCYATSRLNAWAGQPRRSTRLRVWRQHLTALANDLAPEPVRRATFASLITGEHRTAACSPRFVADDTEFGNLKSRRTNTLEWHYLAVTLPAPLPHLFVEASGAGSLPRGFPRAHGDQRLSLGGPFDRRFALYVPPGYERDALFVLTPVVMAALVDHAAGYHLEVTGDTLVFFTAELADFAEPDVWRAVGSVLSGAVPALVTRADRYRDERVPGQQAEERLAAIRLAMTTPGSTWAEADRRIGEKGRRLQPGRRRVRWSRVREAVGNVVLLWVSLAVGGFALVAFVYAMYTLVTALTSG